MPQADPHLGVAKELLLRSRGRGGGRGVVSWPGRAFRAGKAFVCHGCDGAGQLWRGVSGAPRVPWGASLGAGGAGQSKQTRHSYPSGPSQQGGAALDQVWVAAPPRGLWAWLEENPCMTGAW